jgi:Zn-dependent protease with chaperone function
VWQLIGLGACLAAFGAGMAVAVTPLHASVAAGVATMFQRGVRGEFFQHLGTTGALGLTLASDVALALGICLGVTVRRTIKARRHHRNILDLVASPSHEFPELVVLPHSAALVYCLPGMRKRIVFSSGALHALSDAERGAVISHEHGHLRPHHELVMLPFSAMGQTLSWLPYARLAPESVSQLLEMSADDYACRHHSRATVVSALLSLTRSTIAGTPSCGFAATGGGSVQARVERLVETRDRVSLPSVAASGAGVLAVLAPIALCLA